MVGFIVMTFFFFGINLYLGINNDNKFNIWASGFCAAACIITAVFTL